MAAAGGDVDAAALADGAGEREFVGEDFLETARGFGAGGGAVVAGGGVERDEVHLRGEAAEEMTDGAGVVGGVVFAVDERPLVEDAAAGGFAVGAAGGDEFVERPLAGGGDEGGALGLRGGVQGDGEMERAFFAGEAEDAGDDADGAERDALGGEGEAAVVAQDVDGAHDGVVVVQRFAHAHEDDVAEAFAGGGGGRCGVGAEGAGDVGGLGDDFAGGEMAGVAHLAGGAENAAHGASDLARDAGGDAAGEAHENGFDAFGVGEGEEVFTREAVGGIGGGGDGEGADEGFGGEAVADAGGEVGHRVEGVDEIEVEVGPETGGVGRVKVALDQPRAEVGTGEIVEVGERGLGHGGGGGGRRRGGKEREAEGGASVGSRWPTEYTEDTERGRVGGGRKEARKAQKEEVGCCPRNTRTGAKDGDFVRVV